jgi:hypothetical protein
VIPTILADIGPTMVKVLTAILALMFIWYGITGLMRRGRSGRR